MEQAKEPTPKLKDLQAIHFVLSAWYEVTSLDVTICRIVSIEEMCGDAINKNNGEAEDNINTGEAEHTPVPSMSEAIMAFETEQAFSYAHEITEKDLKNVNLESLPINLKDDN
ncbi:hypothetical protein NPIL_704951 [Nephila pilipes]|uniref:Uncharacterized protein n=1 Tax=Nephila pilipes TaxID=299642 RepID=A0A8X6QLP4_NEPPI|nr:hypothetical protein NPIL_704951 [Nephila pilipes]